MKKSILILCTVLTVFSLTAFGYNSWNDNGSDQEKSSRSKTVIIDDNLLNFMPEQADPDLVYNVDSRFINTITKENLYNAKSIIDILPEKATESIVSYQEVEIIMLQDEEISEPGDGDVLNAAQLTFIQSIDYSTNILVKANYKIRNEFTGELYGQYLTYYITILPEKEAEFASGYEALIEYLKENSKEKTTIIKQDKLQPGKVSFTVTEKGEIAKVKLTSTSGYPSIDKALVELITNMPGKWNPATNSKGEKVDQELVFFFGLQGC